MSEFIQERRDGRVLKLLFDRPAKKNAITHDMYAALAGAINRAQSDDSVRVIYLTSEGDIFTAGNDLGDFANNPPQGADAPVFQFLSAMVKSEKPVMAAVNGPAVGIGLSMLLHCDLVFAAQSASFQAPFVDLALVPENASSLLLPRVAGYAWANDMFLLGRTVNAAEALHLGIVSRVFPDASLQKEAIALAHQLAKKAPQAVRLTKQLVRDDRAQIIERIEKEGFHFGEQLMSAELQEAIAAFVERREPNFD
jgi:enoyl-CoA hydratase/carnithine racemase